jgi:hypothetical protein
MLSTTCRNRCSLREVLAEEAPTHLDALRDVAVGHQVLCEIQAARDAPAEALAACRRAEGAFGTLHELDQDNHQGIVDVARVHRSLAGVLASAGDAAGAEAALARAATLREQLF